MKDGKVSKTALERRNEIVQAAIAVIAEQGIQNLSLSAIEKKADMSRGQLTYYFPAKEDILLAVFERLVDLMHERVGKPTGPAGTENDSWSWVRHLLHVIVTQAPVSPEFGCLQYTFLSQIGHREDFRDCLATLYEQWRSNMAAGFANDLMERRAARSFSPRAMATLVQAILHGLGMQRAADPASFDAAEVSELCLDVLGTYLWQASPATGAKNKVRPRKAALKLPAKARPLSNGTARKEVNGERVHG
jgi:AcrR family transcriptional regulator